MPYDKDYEQNRRNKEKRRENQRKYRKLHPRILSEEEKKKRKDYYQKNKEKLQEFGKEYYKSNKEKALAYAKLYRDNKKDLVYDHYGRVCVCCGETTPEFLTLDHINNDGANHRKAVRSGLKLYLWIIENEFPEDLQVLCYNCNCAKGHYGKCPHVFAKKQPQG